MKFSYEHIPAIVVNDFNGFPGSVVNIPVEKPQNIKAAKIALKNDNTATVIIANELKETGVALIVEVIQIIKSSSKNTPSRLVMEIKERAYYDAVNYEDGYYVADLSEFETIPLGTDKKDEKAMLKLLEDYCREYAVFNENIRETFEKRIKETDNFEKLIDNLAAGIPYEREFFNSILEEESIFRRFEILLNKVAELTEMEKYKKGIADKVVSRLDNSQKEFYLREQMNIIREELGDDNMDSDVDIYMQKCSELIADDSVKEKIVSEIKKWHRTNQTSPENSLLRDYIETLLVLPWEKLKKENNDIKHAEMILEKNHYGMEDVKERVIEAIAVSHLAPKGKTPIICLVGPPGTGKTSIGASIAEALDRNYVRISLGGVRDEAEIRGHRRTYVGAMPGKIVSAMKNAGVANPLILLDEIDKVSNDYKGDTFSALLEVLDPEQNKYFTDHYVDIPVDLSHVFFICTANTTQTIPEPLLDRMEIINISSYTQNEKFHIAEKYLISKQMEKCGLKKSAFKLDDKALLSVIFDYTREAGVRQLERLINKMCRKAARMIVSGERKSVKITVNNLEKYLGKPVYQPDGANKVDEIGIVNGLAWTSVGGAMLEIEVNVMDGKGKIELTGMMGDVMKESAMTAVSCVRSFVKFSFDEHDIHIHIPEGSVPKDGPSAGITMATAIYSAITGNAVRSDTAMTGEITLRGRILPIGGLKEKLLAAKNAGIKNVIVPTDNKKDINEISDEIKGGIRIIYAGHMNEVLDFVLIRED